MERQFVVQLENRPGELAAVARALGCRGINIQHISCVGAGSVACCFLTTERSEQTREVLSGLRSVLRLRDPQPARAGAARGDHPPRARGDRECPPP